MLLSAVALSGINYAYERNRAVYDENYQIWEEKQIRLAEQELEEEISETDAERKAESEIATESVEDLATEDVQEKEPEEYALLSDEDLLANWEQIKRQAEELQAEATDIQTKISEYDKQLALYKACKEQSSQLSAKYSLIRSYANISFSQKYDSMAISRIEKKNNQYYTIDALGNAVGFGAGIFTGYFTASAVDENNTYYQRINQINNFFAEQFEECTVGIQCNLREINGILEAYELMFSDTNSLETKLFYQDILSTYADGKLPEKDLENCKYECIKYLYQYSIVMDEAIRVYSSVLTSNSSTDTYLYNLKMQKEQVKSIISDLGGESMEMYISEVEKQEVIQAIRNQY